MITDNRDIDEYQDWTINTAVYEDAGTGSILEVNYLVHGLTGEAGEVANLFKKVLRDDFGDDAETALKDPRFVSKMLSELGDVVYYLSRLAASLNMPMSSILSHNHSKLMQRMSDGRIRDTGTRTEDD